MLMFSQVHLRWQIFNRLSLDLFVEATVRNIMYRPPASLFWQAFIYRTKYEPVFNFSTSINVCRLHVLNTLFLMACLYNGQSNHPCICLLAGNSGQGLPVHPLVRRLTFYFESDSSTFADVYFVAVRCAEHMVDQC